MLSMYIVYILSTLFIEIKKTNTILSIIYLTRLETLNLLQDKQVSEILLNTMLSKITYRKNNHETFSLVHTNTI